MPQQDLLASGGLAAEMLSTLSLLETETARVARGDTPEITLPEGMPLHLAIRHLEKRLEEESTRVDVSYAFDCWPLEGAYGLQKVLEKRYGYALSQAKKIQTMFGTKEIKPEIRRLQIGHNKFKQVVWGQFSIPAVADGVFETSATMEDGDIKFQIIGTIRNGDRKEVDAISQDLREWLTKNSIYRGQAITVRTNNEGGLSPDHPPEFLDVSNAKTTDLILPQETDDIVNALIFGPLQNTDVCRDYGVKLNRGSLLHGPYGTGKTLCAMVAAAKATRNGWTFFYVDNPKNLLTVTRLARRYQPAVVFCEDVDQFLGDRDGNANEIINELDGLTSKDVEVMTIMTTNHLERIHQSVLRQGRMDLILEFPTPDAKTVEKLVRMFAGADLDASADISEVGVILEHRIPASIAECVRRAKLVQIASTGDPGLSPESLVIAARSLEEHLKLLEPRPEQTEDQADIETIVAAAATAFTNLVSRKSKIEVLEGIEEAATPN